MNARGLSRLGNAAGRHARAERRRRAFGDALDGRGGRVSRQAPLCYLNAMLRMVPWFVPLSVVPLDQWTKAWARAALHGGAERALLGRFLGLRLTSNSGALFGATGGVPQEALRAGLILAGLVLCLLLTRMAVRAADEAWPRRAIAFALVTSGLLSNTLDRVWLGRVTDFLHFRLAQRLELGTINVADLALFGGLLLLIPELFGSQTPRSMPNGPRIPRS